MPRRKTGILPSHSVMSLESYAASQNVLFSRGQRATENQAEIPGQILRSHSNKGALCTQICLNFDVWHMNFNSDMTSMRKNHLLSSSHSRQLWEATGWLTECSEEHVSSIWGWVPHASSVRELYWHHVWVRGSLQSHQMGSTVRSLLTAGEDRHWWLSPCGLSAIPLHEDAHKTITLL